MTVRSWLSAPGFLAWLSRARKENLPRDPRRPKYMKNVGLKSAAARVLSVAHAGRKPPSAVTLCVNTAPAPTLQWTPRFVMDYTVLVLTKPGTTRAAPRLLLALKLHVNPAIMRLLKLPQHFVEHEACSAGDRASWPYHFGTLARRCYAGGARRISRGATGSGDSFTQSDLRASSYRN